MNLLFSCIGKRGYIADFFRPHLETGDRIVGSGNTQWTPGFQACDAAVLLPDIASDDYVDAVLEACDREQIDAVLSFADPDVHKLALSRERFLERGIVPVFPEPAAAAAAFDKYLAYELFVRSGIDTPPTAIDLAGASDFPYPMYVKPRRGSGSHQTFLARTREELEVFFHYSPDMIIQPAVVGEEINIELCGDLHGRTIGISTWKKHRSRLGETEQAETFRDDDVIDFGLHLGEVLGVVGPMDVDVIRTESSFVALEANTRFGGGYPVSHLAGADFPRLIVQLVEHGRAEPNFDFKPGVVMMKTLGIVGGPSESFFVTHLAGR